MKTKNKINSKWFVLFVSCVILFPLTSSAELLIEESFKTGTNSAAGEYELIPTGSPVYYPIAYQTNSVTGFTDAWFNAKGSSSRIYSGLAYTNVGLGMVTSGSSINPRANDSRMGRKLAVPFDANTTGIYYLGFLYKQAKTSNGYRSPFGLYSSATMLPQDRVVILSMGNATTNLVNLEVLGTTTNLGEPGTSVNFAVFRFNMSSVDKSDSVALYLNPPLDARLELQTPIYTSSGLNITFNTLGVERAVSFAGGNDDQNVFLDEIRMSKSYYEVSTVHPSGMTVLVIR